MADEPPNWQNYPAPSDEPPAGQPAEAPAGTPPISLYPPGGSFPAYHAPTERRRVRRRIGALLTTGAIVVGGAGFAVWTAVDAMRGDDQPATSTHTVTESEVDVDVEVNSSGATNLLTAAGIADLNAALRAETGSTRVFEVAIFRNTAVVTVPDQDAPDGARVYQWDGTLTALAESMSVRKPFDFTKVKGDVLARLCGDSSEQCTVVVGRPLGGDRAWLTVVGSEGPKRTDLSGNPV